MKPPLYITLRISANPSIDGEVFDPQSVRECLPIGKEVRFNLLDTFYQYRVVTVEEEKEGVYVTFHLEEK